MSIAEYKIIFGDMSLVPEPVAEAQWWPYASQSLVGVKVNGKPTELVSQKLWDTDQQHIKHDFEFTN